MLNGTPNNLLSIMPEDFYFDTLRKNFIQVLSTIKFDPVLVSTVEEVMNKADASAVNKRYKQLENDLNPLAVALLSKNYQKSDSFIRADEEEKVIVRNLTKNIQDLLTIVKCTEEPETKAPQLSRERLNYDVNKKENVVMEKNDDTKHQRQRIPNM